MKIIIKKPDGIHFEDIGTGIQRINSIIYSYQFTEAMHRLYSIFFQQFKTLFSLNKKIL